MNDDIWFNTEIIDSETVIRVDAATSTGVMMSTLWNQSGIMDLGNNKTITYNYYCPTDTKTQIQSVTGCTNTAAAQIIYYFIENYDFDLQLTLNAQDEYISTQNGLVINIKADGSTPGTVSFNEINNKLADYDINSADDAAALTYACGVVQEAYYSSSETSTAWMHELFERAGFSNVNIARLYNGNVLHWGNHADNDYTLTDAAFEIIIENLLAGKVVGTSYPGHALVIDGYDAVNDKFHINFGWGDYPATTWYTREEMRQQQYYEFVYDLMLDGEGEVDITVSDPDLYGTGTILRAFEVAENIRGFNRITFEDVVDGVSVDMNSRVYFSESIEINNYNMTAMVMSDVLFYGENASELTFNNFNGEIIVNNKETSWIVYAADSVSLTFNASNALLFSGSYAVNDNYSAGAEQILTALRYAQQNNSILDSFAANAGAQCYSIVGSNAVDNVTIDDHSIFVGDIYLGASSDNITVTNYSQIYGNVIETSGRDNLRIDSTSHIQGDLYGIALTIDLTFQKSYEAIISTGYTSFNAGNTITVDVSGSNTGEYILFEVLGANASDAANYFNTLNITITGIDGGSYVINTANSSANDKLQLVVSGNQLKLSVKEKLDTTPPTAPLVTADIKTPTNQDVHVTAIFSADSAIREYSYDQQTWYSYTDSITVTINCSLYFRATDKAGNVSAVTTYKVDNIDRVAPEAPEAYADITEKTNKDVTVTVQYSQDSVVKEYSLDNETWHSYTTAIVMVENGTIYLRSVDEAGNVSAVTVFEVTNIDKSGPDKPVAFADVTAPTLGNVIVSATFSEESIKKEYSLDNETWYDYTGPILMTDNGPVYFRGIDSDGNPSIVTVYEVANIDRTPPEKPIIIPSTDQPTNQSVIINAIFTEDSVVKEYSYDQQNWFNYTTGVMVHQNTTIYFRAKDVLDNTSETVVYEVNNIDRFAPDAPAVFADIITKTNGNVLLTAQFSDDSAQNQYSFDNNTWFDYTEALEIVENTDVFFRGIDAAGNISDVIYYKVDNIDRTAPINPVIAVNTTELTNQAVIIQAAFAADALYNQYSFDEEEWFSYSGPVEMFANGNIYFRSTDEAGNISGTVSYTVSNIDIFAPEVPINASCTVDGHSVEFTWDAVTDNGKAGVAGYYLRYGKDAELSGYGIMLTANSAMIEFSEYGEYFYQICAVDKLGNISDWSETGSFFLQPTEPTGLSSSVNGVSWLPAKDAEYYDFEYSRDNFIYSIRFSIAHDDPDAVLSIDTYNLPNGMYRWKVCSNQNDSWQIGNNIVQNVSESAVEEFISNNDGNLDLFFANPTEVWGIGYKAEYQGFDDVEISIELCGKNRIVDVFQGSNDSNVLFLSDDANGDALFIDDIYSAAASASEQARINKINEIRAGAGNDIIDLTSDRLSSNNSIKISGGAGDDQIWMGNGNHFIFGDTGDDCIISGSGNDIIVGGAGNDYLCGGTGDDLFIFGDNWGNDTVRQISGSVTLWFESGSSDNWDEETLTYTCGSNSVTVVGTTDIHLVFGTVDNAPTGAFADAFSENIFEKKNKGQLA